MNLQNIFKQLGLKTEHLQIYLANLEWGETSITNIARKSGIARTTIYSLIDELLDAGLITQTLKQGKKFYSPADPEYLLTLLKKRKLELEDSLVELKSNLAQIKAMQNNKKHKPKIKYLEGAEGIKQAYEKSLEGKEQWIQCFTEDYRDVVSDEFFDDYFKRLFSSDAKTKELLTLSDSDYIEKWGSEKNLQLMVDHKGKIETDTIVYDNTVIFVSFNKENPYALIIEDEQVAACMKSMFDNAWKHAAKEDPRVKIGESVKTEF